jgi:hypothetical protein
MIASISRDLESSIHLLDARLGRITLPRMDIAGWLRGRGLGQYEPVFRDNDIDGAVLPSLATEDLKDLGVTSVGHRCRLLEAMRRARGMNRPDRQRLRTPRRHGWSWPVIAAHGREKLSRMPS